MTTATPPATSRIAASTGRTRSLAVNARPAADDAAVEAVASA